VYLHYLPGHCWSRLWGIVALAMLDEAESGSKKGDHRGDSVIRREGRVTGMLAVTVTRGSLYV